MDKTDKNKKLEAFAQNLLQKGKEAGMIWNGVNWVPAEGASKTSPTSPKSPKPVSSSSTKKSVNFFSDFKKTIIPIAKEISLIKKAVVRFSANQEKIKKEEDDQRRKERNEKYLSKYKKPTAQKIESDKKSGRNLGSLFSSLTSLFTGIIKFFLIGFGLILLADFLKKAGVKDAIKNFIKKVLEVVSDLITKGAELIHDILKPGEISNKIIDFIQLVINTVLKVTSDFTEFLRNFVNKISSDQELLTKLQTIIENIVTTIFTVVMTAIDSIKESISKFGPEISKAILDGVIFILNGIASGIQYVTTFFNSQEFRQSFADLVQSVYDLIVSILNVEIPIPGMGSVKLITLIIALEGTVLAAKLAFSTLTATIYGWIAKRALSSAIGGMDCSGVLGGKGGTGTSGKPGKRKKGFFETGASVLQYGGLAAGAVAAYSTLSDIYERDEQLEKFEDAPTIDPSTTAREQAPTQNYVDQKPPSQTPTQTGVSTTVNNSFVATSAPAASQSSPQKIEGPTSQTFPITIKEVIGKGEGGRSGYDATYGFGYGQSDPLIQKMYGPRTKLTELTIDEALAYAAARGKNQGALGKYQFMPNVVRGNMPKLAAYGINGNSKFDEKTQETLYKVYNEATLEGLKRNGIPTSPENIYMAHGVGVGGFTKLYRHPNQNANVLDVLNLTGAQAKTNPQLNTSIADYRARMTAKFTGMSLSPGESVAAGQGNFKPYPVSGPANEQRQSQAYSGATLPIPPSSSAPPSSSSSPTQVAQGSKEDDINKLMDILSGERMGVNKPTSTMSFSPKVAGAELKTSSKEVQNLMDQNDVLNRILNTTGSNEAATKDTVISKTATNNFSESGSNKLDFVYDEDFVQKLLRTSMA